VITFTNPLKNADELLVVLSVDLGQVDTLEVAFLFLSVKYQLIGVLIDRLPATLLSGKSICRYSARHHTDSDDSRIDAASP
jgi:hypothetical protein